MALDDVKYRFIQTALGTGIATIDTVPASAEILQLSVLLANSHTGTVYPEVKGRGGGAVTSAAHFLHPGRTASAAGLPAGEQWLLDAVLHYPSASIFEGRADVASVVAVLLSYGYRETT